MGLFSRIKSLITRGEGDVTPGPWYLPVSNGFLSTDAGSSWNWWQRGYNVEPISATSAMVEACISAYAQTVAMCPGDHWLLQSDGGRRRVTTSALSRILREPNSYQTSSDFLLNIVRHVYAEGNAYALALRNSRYEISELHLMNPRSCGALVSYDGEIFYSLSGNVVLDQMIDYPALVPARDVLHIRLNTSDYDPLRGISPIMAAAKDIAANDAMMAQQIAFYVNQARPSAVLSTDLVLDRDQVQQLRDRWNEQSQGIRQGGTPILTAGLKPLPLPTINSNDAQLADIMKMTEQHVALAFRIPLQILGIGGAPLGSTEALMEGWLATSLGFCLNHVETAFDRLFGLRGQPDEYTEFDTEVLLRSNFKDRIEGLVRGVQGGILAPNEGRAKLGYGKVAYGDEPRVQQQLVPLSAAAQIPAAPGPGAPPPAAPVSAHPAAPVKALGQLPRDISDVERAIAGRRLISAADRQRGTRLSI